MTTNKSIVFELPEEGAGGPPYSGVEALVTVWGDDNPPTIALRPATGGTWGPPVDAVHVEGDWPPSPAVLRAIDHVSVQSLTDGNPFAHDAEMAAGRYDDGNDRSLGVAVVDALLAIAAEIRAARGGPG